MAGRPSVHRAGLLPSPPLSPLHHNRLSGFALGTLYPAPAPLSLVDLSRGDIGHLTRFLSPSTRCQTRTVLEALPASLRNPTLLPQAATISLLHSFGASDALPPASRLCQRHRHLNAQIIASVLGAIEGEIEDFLPEVLAIVGGKSTVNCLAEKQLQCQKIGNVDLSAMRKGYTRLSPLALHHVHATEDAMSLTLPAQEFAHFYRRTPTTFTALDVTGTRRSHCDACLLQTVASSTPVLIGLRAILLSRSAPDILSAQRRSPRLELIECWMQTYGMEEATHMLQISGRIAWELSTLLRRAEDQQTFPTAQELLSIPVPPARPWRGTWGGGVLPIPKTPEGVLRAGRLPTPPTSPAPPVIRYATKPFSAGRASCVPKPLRIRKPLGTGQGECRAGSGVY